MFVSKRLVPYLHQTVAVLSTTIKEHNETGLQSLVRIINYLNGTNKNCLTLSADYLKVIKLYADASFAVRPYFKSRNGVIMTMGHRTIQSVSRKQKLNKRSITEDGLVAVYYVSVYILWTVLFIEWQG